MTCDSSPLQARDGVEHHDAIGHLLRRPHVVRHDDAGDGVMLPGADDQFVDHVAHDRVQPGGRLVVEHDLGFHRQRAGQPDALPHAARQFGRLLGQDRFRQPDFGEPRDGDVANLAR